jgi:hypothetical protein
LAVLEEMPRHSGHRLLAKKKARPQQGNGTGLEETARPGSRQRLRSNKECRCRAEGCSLAQILSLLYPERKAIQSLLQQALMDHAHGHLPLKRFPVFVTHHFGSKCRSVRLDGLAKQENLALELFSVCHFVALTGERVAFFLASNAEFPCLVPCVVAVPVPTLARLSDRSTSQMIYCRSWLSSLLYLAKRVRSTC